MSEITLTGPQEAKAVADAERVKGSELTEVEKTAAISAALDAKITASEEKNKKTPEQLAAEKAEQIGQEKADIAEKARLTAIKAENTRLAAVKLAKPYVVAEGVGALTVKGKVVTAGDRVCAADFPGGEESLKRHLAAKRIVKD